MKKFSTDEKITKLLILETNLLNYRMKEFAHLIEATDEGKVYRSLASVLGKGVFSKRESIDAYLSKNYPQMTNEALKEQAAMILNLMSRSSENVYHTVSMLKFNHEVDRFHDENAPLTAKERKEMEAQYEEDKVFYTHIAKKTDRIYDLLTHPELASEDEKLLLAMQDPKIQKIIEDVYLKLEGKKGNGAKFISLTEVLAG